MRFLLTLLCLTLSLNVASAQLQNTSNVQPNTIKFDHFSINDGNSQYQINFAYSGNSSKPGILFIHGTPGDWSAFESYLNNKSLQNDFFLVSIDRIGWGKSSIEINPDLVTTQNESRKPYEFSLQAESISALMQRFPDKKWMLLGHSLGASIAPKVALLDKNVTAMFLLAGSIKPNLGKPRWFNRVADNRLVGWMLPKVLKYSNNEIMVLKEELSLLESELRQQTLDIEVVVMQGMRDRLVSPKNTIYVNKEWKSAYRKLRVIELTKANHFLPWEQSKTVIKTIYEFDF